MAEGKAMLDQCSSWFKPSAWFYFRGRETSPAPLLTYPQTGIIAKISVALGQALLYAQKQENTGFFCIGTAVFSLSGLGGTIGSLFGAR